MDHFDPYYVFLAIATSIPQRLKTGVVLQGHILLVVFDLIPFIIRTDLIPIFVSRCPKVLQRKSKTPGKRCDSDSFTLFIPSHILSPHTYTYKVGHYY